MESSTKGKLVALKLQVFLDSATASTIINYVYYISPYCPHKLRVVFFFPMWKIESLETSGLSWKQPDC